MLGRTQPRGRVNVGHTWRGLCSRLLWVRRGALGAGLAHRAALTNQELEQNRRQLFPKPLRLLSGVGCAPCPAQGWPCRGLAASPVAPTHSPSSPPQGLGGGMLCPCLSLCWPRLAPRSVWTLLCVRGVELHKGHVPELRGQLGDRQSPPNPGLSPAFGPQGIDH